MTEKIEWYKEVLELEPNSKLFFPLARLLVGDQRREEAIEVLEQGLTRHEEFLEARLFLIELLHGAGREDAVQRQVEQLTGRLASYAGFWKAWAACLNHSGESGDAAAALQFLALTFSRGPVSLREVFQRGLASYEHEKDQVEADATRNVPIPTPETPEMAETPQAPMDAQAEMPEETPDAEPMTVAPIAVEAVADGVGDMGPLHEDAVDVAAGVRDVPGIDTVGEAISLRTRSMAEVLAEQGDIRGAMDIYQELSVTAVDPEERAELRQRMVVLSAGLGLVQPTAPAPEDDEKSAKGKDRLINMLEILAERVEARARG